MNYVEEWHLLLNREIQALFAACFIYMYTISCFSERNLENTPPEQQQLSAETGSGPREGQCVTSEGQQCVTQTSDGNL